MKQKVRQSMWRLYAFLVALVGIVFLPALSAKLLNWDDQVHVQKNAAVLAFNVPGMFMQHVNDIYIPLTSLSFALENFFFGLNPFLMHLDNMLLHAAVTCLLMGFFIRLGASHRASFAGAALFAVHPMHVESVVWVTERKDVLCAFFYILALRQWWSYLDRRRRGDMALAFIWMLLGLLAKPMAVSLPLVMAFLEWWKTGDVRRLRWRAYIPYFLLAFALGAVTYVQHVRSPAVDMGTSALIWVWTLAFYIWKFLLPFIFHPLYALPEPVGFFEPAYLGACVLVGVLAWGLWQVARRHLDRWLLLAAGFFFLMIFIVLRLDAHDTHVVADRFMYLPSVGICLWLGIKSEQLVLRYGRLAQGVIVTVIVLLSVRAFTYARVWQDSITLWSYVIRHYPQKEIAYNNRSVVYGEAGQYDLAVADNTRVLMFPSNRALALYNRGINFMEWAQRVLKDNDAAQAEKLWRLAKEDFDGAIKIDPRFARTYNHRGMVRFALHDVAGAMEDLTMAINRDTGYGEAYNNRGNLRAMAGELDLALDDYRRAISLGDAQTERAYSNIGIIYARKGYPDLALQSFDKAIAANPGYGAAYFNRSVIYHQQGNLQAARMDAHKARQRGVAVDEGYWRSLNPVN